MNWRKASLLILAYFSIGFAYAREYSSEQLSRQWEQAATASEYMRVGFNYLGKDGMNFITTFIAVTAVLYIGFGFVENMSHAGEGIKAGSTVFAVAAGIAAAYWTFMNEVYLVDILAGYGIFLFAVVAVLWLVKTLSGASEEERSWASIGAGLLLLSILLIALFGQSDWAGTAIVIGIFMFFGGLILLIYGLYKRYKGWRGGAESRFKKEKKTAKEVEEFDDEMIKDEKKIKSLLKKIDRDLGRLEEAVRAKNPAKIRKRANNLSKKIKEERALNIEQLKEMQNVERVSQILKDTYHKGGFDDVAQITEYIEKLDKFITQNSARALALLDELKAEAIAGNFDEANDIFKQIAVVIEQMRTTEQERKYKYLKKVYKRIMTLGSELERLSKSHLVSFEKIESEGRKILSHLRRIKSLILPRGKGSKERREFYSRVSIENKALKVVADRLEDSIERADIKEIRKALAQVSKFADKLKTELEREGDKGDRGWRRQVKKALREVNDIIKEDAKIRRLISEEAQGGYPSAQAGTGSTRPPSVPNI